MCQLSGISSKWAPCFAHPDTQKKAKPVATSVLMSRDTGTQGMAVSFYKADEKEAARNKKKLAAIIKRPENTICADCPMKRECTMHTHKYGMRASYPTAGKNMLHPPAIFALTPSLLVFLAARRRFPRSWQ